VQLALDDMAGPIREGLLARSVDVSLKVRSAGRRPRVDRLDGGERHLTAGALIHAAISGCVEPKRATLTMSQAIQLACKRLSHLLCFMTGIASSPPINEIEHSLHTPHLKTLRVVHSKLGLL
jgi:hypothetical protein